MTLHSSRNSVAGQIEGRPLNMVRSIAATPMTTVAKQLRTYYNGLNPVMVRPESEALQFYVLEHAAGVIRAKYGPHDTLPEGELAILDQYNAQSLRIATRAYYYLLLICWREMRYCGSKATTFPGAGAPAGVAPDKMAAFLSLCSEKGAIECSKHWDKAGDITLGQLTKALIHGYRKGKWGSAYGGPKWAVVTECLDAFVWGKTSAAMMLDTVWALAHNTAPIFNKSMLYNGQDKYDLLEILDVQRAGMIPQYILTANTMGYRCNEHISVKLRQSVIAMGKTLGGVFADKTNVDWVQVKALGAIGSYSQYADKLGQKKTASGAAIAQQLVAPAAPWTPTAAQYAIKQVVPGVKVTLGRTNETQAEAA